MNENNIKTIVQHCYKYPSNNCYGYIVESGKSIPVAHTPFLPPFDTIFYEEINKRQKITSLYYSTTENTPSQSIREFCEKKEINTIYIVNLYHKDHKFMKFEYNELSKKFEMIETPSFSLAKIDVNSDVVEFESVFETSL